MHLRSDTRGITLVELIVAVSLLTIVLSSAYYLLFFTTKSMKDTEAEFLAQQEARSAVDAMAEDIRKAQAAYYGTYHKAVEFCDIYNTGWQIRVHINVDGDTELEAVTYKLENNQLKRGVAELGSDPTVWVTLISRVRNKLVSPEVPIFSISNETVNIYLIVTDVKEHLKDQPVIVNTMVTVRSKGAME